MRNLLLPLLAILLFAACTTTENAKKIAGHWHGASWTSNGQPIGQDASSISFSFNEDGTYSYVNAGERENGLYRVDADNVYTRPEGREEIMVKIARVTKDSLVFDMNRAGSAETLTLLRD
ncbi:MAG: hypothetical protein EOO08_08875 [Chitinophagaceae bacterium]|nr:MAG: hypothetical protein EOO08_08875 [Chitinophagaceae bacterium]